MSDGKIDLEVSAELIIDIDAKLLAVLDEIEQAEKTADTQKFNAAVGRAEKLRAEKSHLQGLIEAERARIENTPKDMNDAIRRMAKKRK